MLDHFPSVGEKLMRRPEFRTFSFLAMDTAYYPCVVIFVNPEHHYYQVEFDFNGRTFGQGYKYPDLDDEVIF